MTNAENFPLGFEIYDHQQAAAKLLARGGDQALVQLIAALIANGTTYFEDIFRSVRAVAGDYRLEQRASDLLGEFTGVHWEPYGSQEMGENYRLL